MRCAIRVGLAISTMTMVWSAAPSALAATGSCMSPDGSCELSNEPSSFLSCDCTDGLGVGADYGDDWETLTDAELDALCPTLLDEACGDGPPPPPGIPCETDEGSCVVWSDPPEFGCECNDGSATAGPGEDDWAGLSDDELFDACLGVALDVCGGIATSETGDPTATSTSESDSTAGTDETAGNDTVTSVADTGDEATVTDSATITDTASDSGDSDSSGDTATETSATETSATETSATDASATDASATDASASATNGDESSGGGDTAGSTDDAGGCGCRTGGDRSSAFALALLVGAVLRRRRG